ncbi:toxin glutamine deamidase domain-containing protein [Streptomyces sp. VTCC 41912]|uniref:toxin glutamine deamidase domain-containing protein n=1 Tax=Streptomyces sp. VTCC 41912 TaxID=3383243 RepID=UPI003896BE20
MQNRWETKAAAFLLTLSVLFTGGMGEAIAAEPQQASSVLKKCESLPLLEKLACIKDQVKDHVAGRAAGLGLLLLFVAEHDWHDESKQAFPDLYKKWQEVQKAAKVASSPLQLKEEDFKDPKLAAQAIKQQQNLLKSLQTEFELLYQPAAKSIQLAKAMAQLTTLLAPVLKDVTEFISDPEVKQTLNKINAGFDQMDSALIGLNKDVGQMNKGMAQMNRGLDQMNDALEEMNKALGQVNGALDGMNKALDQVNRAMDQINQAINGANKGIEKANAGMKGMNDTLDELNEKLKGKSGDSPFKDLDLSGVADYVRGGPKAEEDKVRQTIVSAVINLIPFVGDAKGVAELLSGQDSVTGEHLSPADRIIGATIVLRWIKVGKTAIKAEEVVKAVRNEKSFNRIGNIRWGEGGGGKTVLGDSYKTPVTDDLRELVNPGGGKTNCRACVVGVERTLDGTPASALPEIGRGPLTSLEKYFPGKKFVTRSLSNIVKDVKSAGDGARGIVFGQDPRGGHVFNVINRDGDVIFLDAQSGHAAPTGYSSYQFMRTK